jgi:hypothetical protein
VALRLSLLDFTSLYYTSLYYSSLRNCLVFLHPENCCKCHLGKILLLKICLYKPVLLGFLAQMENIRRGDVDISCLLSSDLCSFHIHTYLYLIHTFTLVAAFYSYLPPIHTYLLFIPTSSYSYLLLSSYLLLH